MVFFEGGGKGRKSIYGLVDFYGSSELLEFNQSGHYTKLGNPLRHVRTRIGSHD
jgi:hypothetical protein